MEKTVLWTALLAIFIVIGLPHGSHAARKPKIQTGPEAEVSFDGLHRVDKTVMDEVWAKPDLDLTGYKKIMLASGGLAFREVKSRSARTYRASSEAEFPISEDSKERLREIVREAFAKELAKVERFEITDTPGRDVLIIVGSIIDIVSHVPPEPIGPRRYLPRICWRSDLGIGGSGFHEQRSARARGRPQGRGSEWHVDGIQPGDELVTGAASCQSLGIAIAPTTERGRDAHGRGLIGVPAGRAYREVRRHATDRPLQRPIPRPGRHDPDR